MFVVLFCYDDGNLGPTLGPIKTWDEALKQADALSLRMLGEVLSGEQIEDLQTMAQAKADSGTIYIGSLE